MNKAETKRKKTAHEPLFHIVKRSDITKKQAWGIRAISIVCALIFAGLITLFITGKNPLDFYFAMIDGALGTSRRIWVLLQELVMLLCIALAVTPAFKMKFWNIGAEGQVLIGGLATAVCMIYIGDSLPNIILIPIMIVASMLAGAIWGALPALFKAKWGTNETLFTLMMNYVAIQTVSYFCILHPSTQGGNTIGTINNDTQAGWFPVIAGKEYLLNIIIVAALTVFMYIYLKYTKQGYEISVVGESQNTARYIGVNVKKVIVRTMIISGALCGIAGLLFVASSGHTITDSTAGGRGFTAIIVSWLAKFNPLYMILTSFLIVFLQKGAKEVATAPGVGLNESYSDIITGIIIFFIIGCEFFINYSVKFRKKGGAEK